MQHAVPYVIGKAALAHLLWLHKARQEYAATLCGWGYCDEFVRTIETGTVSFERTTAAFLRCHLDTNESNVIFNARRLAEGIVSVDESRNTYGDDWRIELASFAKKVNYGGVLYREGYSMPSTLRGFVVKACFSGDDTLTCKLLS